MKLFEANENYRRTLFNDYVNIELRQNNGEKCTPLLLKSDVERFNTDTNIRHFFILSGRYGDLRDAGVNDNEIFKLTNSINYLDVGFSELFHVVEIDGILKINPWYIRNTESIFFDKFVMVCGRFRYLKQERVKWAVIALGGYQRSTIMKSDNFRLVVGYICKHNRPSDNYMKDPYYITDNTFMKEYERFFINPTKGIFA